MTPGGAEDWTYPQDFAETVRGIDPSYSPVATEAYVPGREAAFLDAMTAAVESRARVLRKLLETLDCSFVMQVFSETDFLQHALWHVIDPKHSRYRPEQAQALRERVLGFYKALDDLIADIARTMGGQAAILIISDHGAGPLEEFIHANNLLLEQGLLRTKRGLRTRLKHLLFRAGFTPLNVYKLGAALRLGRMRLGLRWTSKGYELLRRLFFSFSDIDWRNSAAYAISGGVYGGIFVNLAGREPAGSVPNDQYRRVRDQLREMLLAARHPRTGAPLVKQVLAREEIYRGRFLAELPDLYFLPSEPTQAVFGDFEFSSNRVAEPASEAISAQHRMDGMIVAAGPGLGHGAEAKGTTVADVVPLVLYLMGLPIPPGLDGKLPTAVLDGNELARRPPEYAAPSAAGGPADKPRQATDDESIKQRLKGLGYIS
jgi:predicted AlkP superfamily phosphohydrolase/phosphomutase